MMLLLSILLSNEYNFKYKGMARAQLLVGTQSSKYTPPVLSSFTSQLQLQYAY